MPKTTVKKHQDAKATYNRLVAEHSDDEATRKQMEVYSVL